MSEDLTKKIPKSDSEKLNEILMTVGVMDTRLTALEQKLTGLEKKVDERLHDTRPIWHRLIADIGQVQVGQQRLEEGLLKLESTVRDVSRDQIVINDSLRRIQLDLHTFDERLHRCERNQRPPNSST
jgi:hypothetical protein